MNISRIKNLLIAALSLSAVVACSDDGATCTSDADCTGGFTCDIVEGETEGACFDSCREANAEERCQAGLSCVDSMCVSGEGGFCTTDADCGSYICDGGTCATSCTDGSECAEGAQCNLPAEGSVGTCGTIPTDPYLYAAVVSNATDDSAFENNTPGPDIDGIVLSAGGSSISAAAVALSELGESGDDGNESTNTTTVLDQDAMTAGETAGFYDCNVDDDLYLALGGDGGFVVVSFGEGAEMTTGDAVTVYEIDGTVCDNLSTDRAEPYTLWIGQSIEGITDVGGLAANFCEQGSSDANGGVKEFGINLGRCE